MASATRTGGGRGHSRNSSADSTSMLLGGSPCAEGPLTSAHRLKFPPSAPVVSVALARPPVPPPLQRAAPPPQRAAPPPPRPLRATAVVGPPPPAPAARRAPASPPPSPPPSSLNSTRLAVRIHLHQVVASRLHGHGAALLPSASPADLRVVRTQPRGAGGYACVYPATLNGVRCAVKAMCVALTLPATLAALDGELQASALPGSPHLTLPMRSPVIVDPTSPHHAALVGLAGVDLSGRDGHVFAEVLIIMPLLDGDLTKFLTHASAPFRAMYALRFLRDTARGLAHLHVRGICHNDVKMGNILTSGQSHGSLCDWGSLAREGTAPPPGTADYDAPERFAEPSRCSPTWDIYAFGRTTAAVFGGLGGQQPPSHPLAAQAAVPPRTQGGWDAYGRGCAAVVQSLPSFSHHMAQRLRVLMVECMDTAPARRPTAQRVVEVLDGMLAAAGWL